MWNWELEALFNAQGNVFYSASFALTGLEEACKKTEKKEICITVKVDIWGCFIFTCWGPWVPVCVCSLYLVIKRHWSTKWLSVHNGFKYIWPAPSANCCYEDFAFVFYSLLSPSACLCFSKSHAPYGRVYYFSLYVPGMHLKYCCEQ